MFDVVVILDWFEKVVVEVEEEDVLNCFFVEVVVDVEDCFFVEYVV